MPTNLPPEYFEAEKKYKEASEGQEKIAALEELISTVPKHKGTDRLRADLRKRLSRLRIEGAKKKRAGRGDLYSVERQGAAQVALVGLANSGKSSLLACLTNAHPVVADFPMSTLMPLSGMMPFEDIQFQLVDLPPIGNESTDGWVSGILRVADMLMLIVDLADGPELQMEMLLDQLGLWKIPLVGLGEKIEKAGVVTPKPVIIAANKVDLPGADTSLQVLEKEWGQTFGMAPVSSQEEEGLEGLRQQVFKDSRVIRAYSKEPGKQAKMDAPFTLSAGSTVLELAESIHKDFVQNLKYACIWGSARFDGQRVQRDYPLRDGDIVEFHVK